MSSRRHHCGRGRRRHVCPHPYLRVASHRGRTRLLVNCSCEFMFRIILGWIIRWYFVLKSSLNDFEMFRLLNKSQKSKSKYSQDIVPILLFGSTHVLSHTKCSQNYCSVFIFLFMSQFMKIYICMGVFVSFCTLKWLDFEVISVW